MLHRDEPKQNLSGHVTFNVPQAHFYREVHNRTKKLELRRRLGLVSNERVRNPMMAERSPRNDFSGFVYKPPPAQPKAERWEYPENDWGLMAKFQSQQPVYRDIFQKEREYSTRMDELHKIKEDNTRVIEREVSKQKQIHVEVQQRREANADAKLHCSQPGYVHPHARVKVHHKASAKTFAPDDLDASLRSDRLRDQVRRQQHMQRLHGHHMGDCAATPPPVTDFYGTAISQFKIIGQTQPEVLREWRAHRAAQFLSKNGPSQCTPPPPAQPHAVVFRPGGIRLARPATTIGIRSPQGKAPSLTASKPRPSSSYTYRGDRGGGVGEVDGTWGGVAARTSRGPAPRPASASSVSNLRLLEGELAKTEEALERQTLKVRLNSKPPHRSQESTGNRASKARKEEEARRMYSP